MRNLTEYLHRKLPEPHEVSAPEPCGTSVSAPEPSGTAQNPPEPHRTLRSLSKYLHWNPPEPHEVSAPEPSGTSRGICTRTLRNPVRNLVLKLHRIGPKLIWAKDPIAKFCCWGKRRPRKFPWQCKNAQIDTNWQVQAASSWLSGWVQQSQVLVHMSENSLAQRFLCKIFEHQ